MSEKIKDSLQITEALTRQIAELARLELSNEEVATFTPQLGQILKYVEQLQRVQVEGVDAMISPIELETPYREDCVLPSFMGAEGKPKVLESAPDTLDDGFKVPPIL